MLLRWRRERYMSAKGKYTRRGSASLACVPRETQWCCDPCSPQGDRQSHYACRDHIAQLIHALGNGVAGE